ncbi:MULTISPECIES: hypothetical protein [unclassified Cyanobium]|uniref:hypothetical protein n=1 Tax=unclassified Cyanobium TaxID=2627006 RepID=UPI0020CE1A4D|nr:MULTISPECIES: hypothetical protein [unclassified Cyanobium]MCP9833954.1 hypothetical protein [Cyanobium sp. La Preciosa 7G6]MCP9936717.1 hypothetical protein [Cyanobium sp. Aljojuca 7A6]
MVPSRLPNASLPPVQPSQRLGALLATIVLAGAGVAPALAAPPSPAQLQALESALNSSSDTALAALLQAGPGLDPAQLESRRRLLRQQFPDARWQLRSGAQMRDGQPTVTLRVDGTRRQGGTTYRLEAEQQLALQSDGTRINGQTVLREQSLLRSGDKPLPVSLLIPDAVLTGQRYDVDVIFDDPLDGALSAGGIAAITPQQQATMASPSMELGALGGGGLFKIVQAPLSPGSQTWAVLLVHPNGIVSATKRVRVVADRQSLEL